MINVLILICLSAIFAYLVLSNKNDEKTPEIKEGAKSSETKKQEDEDTSSTANAQPIETEPPEEEDPGTCETTGDWAMSGECQADGTAIFTQTYKESKPGACPSTEKARVKPCCYQKGDWTDTTGCNERGRKTQKQTTVNCAENFKTREVDCPYVGPWRKTGDCNSSGKQYYVRDVVNSSEPKEKNENCCYISAWSGWTPWSNCNGSSKSKSRTRTVVNCPGTSTNETQTEACSIPISSYFTASCADLGGGSDVISASNLDDCMRKCKNNTHGHGYTCYGLIHGPGFCRVYNNKGLDHGTNICNQGLKTYTLN